MRSRITEAWRRLTARTGAAERLDSVAPATWCLDHATMAGDRLRLSGWAILATDVPVSFAINGRACEHQRWTPRPDVAALYPFVPKRGDCGFEAEARLTDAERDGAEVVKVNLVDRGTGRPLREEQAYCVPGAAAERWPLPDAARRRRVHGTEDEQSFRILGYSNRHKLEWALQNATGAGFGGRVLDWGCGCGRLLRYCGEIAGASFTGADVDSDNLEWCRSHLPMAGYELIPLHPPTPFARPCLRYRDRSLGVHAFDRAGAARMAGGAAPHRGAGRNGDAHDPRSSGSRHQREAPLGGGQPPRIRRSPQPRPRRRARRRDRRDESTTARPSIHTSTCAGRGRATSNSSPSSPRPSATCRISSYCAPGADATLLRAPSPTGWGRLGGWCEQPAHLGCGGVP